MLYRIAHFLRDKFPFVWDLIDIMNSFLFMLRYGRKLKAIEPEILHSYASQTGLEIVRLNEISAERLERFFAAQPEDAYTFFRPHPFDSKSLRKLQRNHAFLSYILIDSGEIVAYCFMRSFFNGKAFRGKMVDYRRRNQGIAKQMGLITSEIAQHLGLRLYGTISKANLSSIKSSEAVNKIKVIEELPNGFIYIEYLPKEKTV